MEASRRSSNKERMYKHSINLKSNFKQDLANPEWCSVSDICIWPSDNYLHHHLICWAASPIWQYCSEKKKEKEQFVMWHKNYRMYPCRLSPVKLGISFWVLTYINLKKSSTPQVLFLPSNLGQNIFCFDLGKVKLKG